MVELLYFAISWFLSSFWGSAGEGKAKVLQYEFLWSAPSEYRYSYETSNGIKRNETGEDIPSIHDANNAAALVKGSYSYTGADGILYTVNYVADEAGFHPEGAHLNIPPFTPWIPGQPIDDGQYREDHSGEYKPDNSGKYRPDTEVQPPFESSHKYFRSGERFSDTFTSTSTVPTIVTQKYLPLTTPKYHSGEIILDTSLTADKLSEAVTSKYLPSSSSSPSYVSGENLLDAFRASDRPTEQYLPSTPSSDRRFVTENPLDNDLIQKAFFNKPTPHPDILLHSTPKDKPTILGLPKFLEEATENRHRLAKGVKSKDSRISVGFSNSHLVSQ
ncbi:uncharacterized protein [Euwallacea fornicatus]|uniref:uncharacterized protein isoform X2 n=1 Tax=Euwallacea fornicatus TaxID=995702 RepID=UPI003390139B